ncbi:MAG: amidohydrolase family protein, partial [Betaproteobacteria bacterium]|nr:amidohydrolase family protein [Betaproteobacteria bacterium]
MTSIGHRRIDLSVALFATVSLLFTGGVPAQVGTDRIEGLRDHTPRWHALTDVRLVVAPGKVIEHGTLVMKDGVIQAAGAQVQIPAGARVWKLDGRTVYAGFVDLASNVGVPANLRAAPFVLPPQLRAPGAPPPPEVKPLTARAIASRNIAVHAEQEVAQHLEWKAEEVKAARDSGFTSVLAAPSAGVFRGQGALVDLADGTDAKAMVLLPRASTHVSHDAERSFGRIYPNSMMGAIALLRQTFYDARWYRSAQDAAAKGGERPEPNATLDALLPALAGKQPVMYQAGSEQDFNRIAKIRDEFKLRVVAQGNGFEYRQLAQLKASALPVLVPVNFPAAPDVSNPDSALDVPLELLQHWEQAPSNLSRLHAAGIDFAITANGVKDIGKEFWPNLRTAVKRGLGADQALAALTSNPARLIGAPNLGTLEPGKIANVVVASGDLFASDQAEIELTFVDGKPYPTAAYQRFDARGTWSVTENGTNKTWTIAGTRDKPQ